MGPARTGKRRVADAEAARRRGLWALLATTFFAWGGFFMVVPLIAVHYVEVQNDDVRIIHLRTYDGMRRRLDEERVFPAGRRGHLIGDAGHLADVTVRLPIEGAVTDTHADHGQVLRAARTP